MTAEQEAELEAGAAWAADTLIADAHRIMQHGTAHPVPIIRRGLGAATPTQQRRYERAKTADDLRFMKPRRGQR